MTQTPATPKGYQITAITYTVPSATKTNVEYTVTKEPGRYHCNCPAGQVNKGCWHVKAVVSGAIKPHVKLAAAPVERASELLYA